MASCCNNTVTPRMIKSGRVSVGDKIQLDEELAVSKETAAEEAVPASAAGVGSTNVDATAVSRNPSQEKQYIPAAAAPSGIVGIPGGVVNNPSAERPEAVGQSGVSNQWYQAPLYGINAANSERTQFDPLPFSQMTSYMGNVSLGGTVEAPSIVTPHVPMTPEGYDEEIDYDTVQALNGFLRTQIGRYMRVEQLVGSNTIQDRYGFLVGVGTNFIILQEITTGNIMVLDIFSIRLTYVYYSPPVIPNI